MRGLMGCSAHASERARNWMEHPRDEPTRRGVFLMQVSGVDDDIAIMPARIKRSDAVHAAEFAVFLDLNNQRPVG